MAIKNVSTVYDQRVNDKRSAIEHRATWMGLTYDEGLKAGADAEDITRKAIFRTGLFHGSQHRANCADPEDMRTFVKVFVDDLTKSCFQMDVTECGRDDLKIEFHYCPLIAAWQKQGFDDETIEVLCDMAMDGDRGIAEAMGYVLELTDTIAKGCPVCKLHFHKK